MFSGVSPSSKARLATSFGRVVSVSCWRSTTSDVTGMVSASTRPRASRIRPRMAGTCTILSPFCWAATARSSPPATWRNQRRVRSPAKSATTIRPMTVRRRRGLGSLMRSPMIADGGTAARSGLPGLPAGGPESSPDPPLVRIGPARSAADDREEDRGDQGVVQGGDEDGLEALQREISALAHECAYGDEHEPAEETADEAEDRREPRRRAHHAGLEHPH